MSKNDDAVKTLPFPNSDVNVIKYKMPLSS